MICRNCNTENITKAQFCKHCGNAFPEEQREAAYGRTIYGKIEKLEEMKEYATLEFITGHPVFKTVVLVLILLWGLSIYRNHGNEMTILADDSYEVQRNEENGDYYVLTKEDEVSLRLYLPKEAEEIRYEMLQGETIHETGTFSMEDAIVLQTSEEVFYRLEADYGKKSESILVYVVMSE